VTSLNLSASVLLYQRFIHALYSIVAARVFLQVNPFVSHDLGNLTIHIVLLWFLSSE
jgi:hypothetical protein